MYLSRARIRNYRSVHDSGEIEMEPTKTVLVGVNEAGKTALLKALQQINAPEDTDRFTALRDYPRSRYTEVQRGDRELGDIKVAEATFVLEEPDKNALLKVAPGLTEIEQLTVFRYLDNSLRYKLGSVRSYATYEEVEDDLTRLRAHVAKQDDKSVVEALAAIIAGVTATEPVRGNFAQQLTDWLKTALPLVDEDKPREVARFQRLREQVGRAAVMTAAAEVLLKRIPLFVYYSTYFTVRPRINLTSLAQREASGDLDEEYDFGNSCLLKLLGFTAKELSDLAGGEPQPSQHGGTASEQYHTAVRSYQEKLDDRQYRLNAASVELTTAIREVWGDERVQLRLVADGQYLKVVVVDDLGVEVELDQRSEGFRWLVSFFVVFKAQAQGELKDAILLLDEPGLSLHALKQQEFRKTVSRLAEDNQVVYTTHSPFMVGTDELDLVRIVEMKDRDSGTKVHTRLVVDDPRSVYPLQAALGYELAQSLFGQARNLVCEGITDMMYVEALNAALSNNGAGLKRTVALVPAASASKVVYYSTLLVSQNLKVAALLDSDQAGEQAAKQDELVRLLNKRQILRTKDYAADTVSGPEIEDMLRDTLVTVAKDELGWDVTATANAQSSRRIVDIFTAEITGFSKYKLVRAFIRWLAAHDITELSQDEQSAVTQLFADINRALN
ncbi:hypothetical protein RAJCM14343_2000 [Rhodococcus aetherivorans]|uniref:Endonuclease GajA/Old nuclease/RecF-like AAA domain-containing protein n=1 Tax=Rhodococcus aetherivorans TaxID=191292 RepID=A0ABQ0YJK6_9NOCA|nr:AAA family ATPase [Rhodococcus aetherivorans]ETT27862.1 hypothetical protein RR21198_1502 [Rhodococcus rhodochrous ATCC 21198]NGP29207.1 ATP-binding protein [Rhodococcus aetherivorans]GES36747.1 hypothetical protein RAJCM14343_2000 [Rhodococcus aetherivorans]